MIRKEIDEGMMLPPFYGLAYYDYLRRIGVCYPIPLNFLVAGIRHVWFVLKRGCRPAQWELREGNLVSKSYAKGRSEGYDNGFNEGYRKGVEDGKAEAARIIAQVFTTAREGKL